MRGFKPVYMAQKPVSSILEKIRQRKMEVSKKRAMVLGRRHRSDSSEIALEKHVPKEDFVSETLESRPEKATLVEPTAEPSAMDANINHSPAIAASEDEHSLSQTITQMHMEEKTMPSFRAPLNDTQDLFSDSPTSEMQSDQSNEVSGNLAEEPATSSLPSLNFKFDSTLPDDFCSDKEESDENNSKLHQQTLFKGTSSPHGDPVKEFVDEEALEDDSDNDILQFEDEDECDNADVEEVCDYIASDYNEKPVDHERHHELHQMWLQQQDVTGTENLLQKLKYGSNQRELPVLSDEDDDRQEDESDDDNTGDLLPMPGVRVSTKKLKQMIPQMFTDKDDGFVSSEDEETERKLSKQQLLQKLELVQLPKLFSPATDKTLGRIKKLNAVSESRKKAKTSYLFDSLLIRSDTSSSSKSSFLRRSSSHPVTSNHRTGPSTGRSFIFGRDDRNSRSSISLSEDSSTLSQDTHAKKNASAKFISSQKQSTEQTATITAVSSSISLFEVLRHPSIQKGHDAHPDMVDHQAVFAAFKPVKKRVKIEGRS